MNRVSQLVCTFALSLGALTAHAAGGVPKDIARAQKSQTSLFNNPQAKVTPIDPSDPTKGHIASLYQKSSVGVTTPVYGQQAVVHVEVTDPAGILKGGAKKAPAAVLGVVVSQVVTSGHDLGSTRVQSNDMTMTLSKASKSYAGSTTISALFQQGNDMNIGLGNASVAVAGANNSWISNNGQNFPISQ